MKILKFQLVFLAAALMFIPSLQAQKKKPLEITSPGGTILLKVETAPKLQLSAFHKGQEITAASPVSMTLQNGEVLGENARIVRQKTEKINTSFNAINYRKAVVQDVCTQGTRVNMMAQYIVFEVPVQMLADNPTAYLREPECTGFITKIPTTFDETVPLDGKVAEYVAIARRKADTWFIGAMTSWTPRELTIDFSFLPEGNYRAEIFSDGINADRDATDYKTEAITIKKGDTLKVKMMSGGGWAARLEKTE